MGASKLCSTTNETLRVIKAATMQSKNRQTLLTLALTVSLVTPWLQGCGAQSTQSQSSTPTPSTPGASAGSAGASAGSVGASAGSAGASAGSVGASVGSAGVSVGSAGASAGTAGASAGDASVSVGSAGANAGSVGASAGNTGASVGKAGSRAGNAGASAGTASTPNNPSPGATRSGANTQIGTARGETRPDKPSDTPPGLEPGQQDTLEDFSEATQPASAASTSERVADLDSALDRSISGYDGMILREREKMANRANAAGSEEELAEEEVNGPLFDEIGSAGEADQEGPGSAYETAGNGGSPGTGDRGPRPQNASAPPPEDLPSGNDDDIVARQIREAAMNETDPQLREKLWEEYRRYKNQR